MTVEDFVKKRKYLFWSTKNYAGLSKEAVVEAILNYGSMDDVRELISLLGIKEVAKIFREKSKKSKVGRQNYFPKIINYFSLYFRKYAS